MAEQNIFDRGISKVRGVASDTFIEQKSFIRAFVRLCNDAWGLGWHEANGGNLSYRLTADDVSSCRSYFNEVPGEWVVLGVQADSLRGEFFAVTAAGSHFRNMSIDVTKNMGIVEINSAGDAFRVVWGMKENGAPTSEFAGHFMDHAVRKVLTNDVDRVVYHAHPASVNALTLGLDLDDRKASRLLWKTMSESLIVFPEGVGVVSWEIPGSPELAVATSKKMELFRVAILEQHGVFCAGASFDEVVGIMSTLEKAADIAIRAKSVNPDFDFESALTDADLRNMAETLNLPLNETFLD